MASHSEHKLGSGTFGDVVAKGGYARKYFDKLEYLIQEVLVTLYMNDSPYTVNLVSYNFENLYLETEMWDMDLRKAIGDYNFSLEEKLLIFKQVLLGLSHLNSRGITHSDLKPSNILINIKDVKVCLADLGLSSTHKHAKKRQTAPAYCPDIILSNGLHDMFGAAVTMTELFADIRPQSRCRPSGIRSLLKRVPDKKVSNVIAKMCPDDASKAISPQEAYAALFEEAPAFPMPSFVAHTGSLSPKALQWLQKHVEYVTTKAGIDRSYRCYMSLVIYLENPANPPVPSSDYPLYIGVMCMIFSAAFGLSGFGVTQARGVTSNKASQVDVYVALYNIFRDMNVVRFIMQPGSK